MHRFVGLWATAFLLLGLASQNAHAQGGLPLLPDSRLVECPKRDGVRETRSDTARAGEWSALFIGSAETTSRSCQTRLDLEIGRDGHERRKLNVELTRGQTIRIVDFSADQSRLALSRTSWGGGSHRDIEIAVFSTMDPAITWANAWDLLGWGSCLAFLYPYGFSEDGQLVINAVAPGKGYSSRMPYCLQGEKLFSIDMVSRAVSELPVSPVKRYGKTEFTEAQACSADPDIAGECFTMRGRLSLYNGSPTVRIWRVGTKRMLGLYGDFPVPYPNWTEVMDFDKQMFATFKVCPLTPKRPGHMQMVCIESMEKVVIQQERDHLPFAFGLPASGR